LTFYDIQKGRVLRRVLNPMIVLTVNTSTRI